MGSDALDLRRADHRRAAGAGDRHPVGDAGVGAGDPDEPDKPAKRFWTARPETASRLRGRIESILNWAKVRGYRQGEKPARWRGHLDHLLPGRGKVRAVKHYAALPYSELGAFMAKLRERDAATALALEFAILTAARTGEVIGAQWSEIDLKGKVWTVHRPHEEWPRAPGAVV